MKRAADLFCGAGGFSTGMLNAARRHARRVKLLAINHWDVAINTHTLNHPEVEHMCNDLDRMDPFDIARRHRIHYLAASPACFAAGTLILTRHGLVPIEEVRIGDFVLTHKGRWRKVVRLFSSEAPIVKLQGYGHYGLETTSAHPFYSKEVLKSYGGKKPDGKRLSMQRRLGEGVAWVEADNMHGRLWASPHVFPAARIPLGSGFVPDANLFYFVGRWLGDGGISKMDFFIAKNCMEFTPLEVAQFLPASL